MRKQLTMAGGTSVNNNRRPLLLKPMAVGNNSNTNNNNSNQQLKHISPSSVAPSPSLINGLNQKISSKTSSFLLKANNNTMSSSNFFRKRVSTTTASALIAHGLNSSTNFVTLNAGEYRPPYYYSVNNNNNNLTDVNNFVRNYCNETALISADSETDGHVWVIPLLGLFAILTTFGNGIVVFSILSEKALRTSTNFCLVSLALADMLVGCIVMPLATSQEFYEDQWLIGSFSCNVFQACDVMASTCSILNLCLISHNRYMAISKPLIYNTSHRRKMYVALGIAATWLCSIAISAPLLLGVNEVARGSQSETICAINNGTYAIYLAVISFFLPSIAIGLQHVVILRALAERARHIKWRVYTPQLSAIEDARPRKSSNKEVGDEVINNNNDRKLSSPKDDDPPLSPQQIKQIPRRGNNYYKSSNGFVEKHQSLDELSDEATATDNHLKPAMANNNVNKVMSQRDDISIGQLTASDDDSVCFEGAVTPPRGNNNEAIIINSVSNNNTPTKPPPKTTHASLDLSINSDGDPVSRRHTVASRQVGELANNNNNINNSKAVPRSGRRNTESLTIVINMPRPLQNDSNNASSSPAHYRNRPRNASILSSPAKCKTSDSLPRDSNNNKKRRASSAQSGRRQSSYSSTRLLREDRAIAMLFMITVGFFTCWLPYFVATIVNGIEEHFVPAIVIDSLRWLGHINSTMNPIFYGIFNKEFRIAVWRRLTLQATPTDFQMSRAPSVVSQMGGVGLSLLYNAASRLNNEAGR